MAAWRLPLLPGAQRVDLRGAAAPMGDGAPRAPSLFALAGSVVSFQKFGKFGMSVQRAIMREEGDDEGAARERLSFRPGPDARLGAFSLGRAADVQAFGPDRLLATQSAIRRQSHGGIGTGRGPSRRGRGAVRAASGIADGIRSPVLRDRRSVCGFAVHPAAAQPGRRYSLGGGGLAHADDGRKNSFDIWRRLA